MAQLERSRQGQEFALSEPRTPSSTTEPFSFSRELQSRSPEDEFLAFRVEPATPNAVVDPLIPREVELEAEIESTRMVPRRVLQGYHAVLHDGRIVSLSRPALVGRSPQPDERWPSARLISVIDTANSVSKKHAFVAADNQGCWITDLASTNGIYVEQPDGAEFELEPGIRTLVMEGSNVFLGEYRIGIERVGLGQSTDTWA